jgi:hypothetical protein
MCSAPLKGSLRFSFHTFDCRQNLTDLVLLGLATRTLWMLMRGLGQGV